MSLARVGRALARAQEGCVRPGQSPVETEPDRGDKAAHAVFNVVWHHTRYQS